MLQIPDRKSVVLSESLGELLQQPHTGMRANSSRRSSLNVISISD